MVTVAIVGGGFCGATCAAVLDGQKNVHVVLFDRKHYYEYTPSVHKAITDKRYAGKIRVPYSAFLKRTKLVTDEIKEVTKSHVKTKTGRYSFDYLVLAAGASAAEPPVAHAYPIKTAEDAMRINAALADAKDVLVVGGGFTGTEIAGELATKTKKRVMIVQGHDRLLERQHPTASHAARAFLEKKGVKVVTNCVVDKRGGMLCNDHGEILHADCVIWAVGVKPNTHFLRGFPLNEKGFVKTKRTLQVAGIENAFAGGDLADIIEKQGFSESRKSGAPPRIGEEKSAQTAEHHGTTIAANIIRLVKGARLEEYRPKGRVMIISLGDWHSILTYSSLTFGGIIPAAMKKMIELWTIRKYK